MVTTLGALTLAPVRVDEFDRHLQFLQLGLHLLQDLGLLAGDEQDGQFRLRFHLRTGIGCHVGMMLSFGEGVP